MARYVNEPTTPQDKQTAQSTAWAEQYLAVGGLSNFTPFAAGMPFLGFGPENFQTDLSVFWEFPAIDGGWAGDLPTEVQPELPEVPPYLQGLRR
jgi:hypothetical protein